MNTQPAEYLIACKVQREGEQGEYSPMIEGIPWAKPVGDFNHRGWSCPHCGGRDYPEKGIAKCSCGGLYRVPYKNN